MSLFLPPAIVYSIGNWGPIVYCKWSKNIRHTWVDGAKGGCEGEGHTFGLYSAFLAWRAIFFRSSLHPRSTVDTIFLHTTKDLNNAYHETHLSYLMYIVLGASTSDSSKYVYPGVTYDITYISPREGTISVHTTPEVNKRISPAFPYVPC